MPLSAKHPDWWPGPDYRCESNPKKHHAHNTSAGEGDPMLSFSRHTELMKGFHPNRLA